MSDSEAFRWDPTLSKETGNPAGFPLSGGFAQTVCQYWKPGAPRAGSADVLVRNERAARICLSDYFAVLYRICGRGIRAPSISVAFTRKTFRVEWTVHLETALLPIQRSHASSSVTKRRDLRSLFLDDNE